MKLKGHFILVSHNMSLRLRNNNLTNIFPHIFVFFFLLLFFTENLQSVQVTTINKRKKFTMNKIT